MLDRIGNCEGEYSMAPTWYRDEFSEDMFCSEWLDNRGYRLLSLVPTNCVAVGLNGRAAYLIEGCAVAMDFKGDGESYCRMVYVHAACERGHWLFWITEMTPLELKRYDCCQELELGLSVPAVWSEQLDACGAQEMNPRRSKSSAGVVPKK